MLQMKVTLCQPGMAQLLIISAMKDQVLQSVMDCDVTVVCFLQALVQPLLSFLFSVVLIHSTK